MRRPIVADPSAANPRTSRAMPRIARTIVAILLGAWLLWQIGTSGIAALAERSADTRLLAATGTPSHPKAGSMLAQALLAAGDHGGAIQVAHDIVLADPTNDRALRVLGLAMEQAGDRDAGANILRQAGGLGWRDTPTQLWVLRDAAVRDDAVTVIQRADALARRNRSPELTQSVFLAAVSEPHMRAALVDSLGMQPLWRRSFFATIQQRLPAASTTNMETLFRQMKAAGQTITPGEWLNYVNRLIDLGQYAHARTIWAGAFGIPAGRLTTTPYDANFALAAARAADAPASQFEWMVDADTAGATFGGTSGSALSIPTEQTSGTTIVSQLLILPPGSHSLSTKIEGDARAAAAGWTITCLPSARALPRRLPRGTDDELSAVAFDVPTEGCGAQRLALTTRDRLEAQTVSVAAVQVR